MKKYLICLVFAVILSNCEVKMQRTNAQIIHNINDNLGNANIYVYQYSEQGMTYRIFHTGSSYGGAYVVNLTKDSLEVALLRKQLNN